MSLSEEAVGVRYTGWAALGRDPQEDTLEYNCPYCGEHGMKAARRTRDQYHFTDGFLQDLQGEMAACHSCWHPLRIAPVVMVHDQDEKRRFEGSFFGFAGYVQELNIGAITFQERWADPAMGNRPIVVFHPSEMRSI